MNAAVQATENMQYARRRWLILATVAIAQLMIILYVEHDPNLRHVYRKLGAHSRHEAVQRARGRPGRTMSV